MAMLDVVFVAHEAQRSGAPIALLNLLRWLRETTEMSFAVVLGADGPLVEEFEELAPVAVADAGLNALSQARLVYANSTWSNALVDRAPSFEAPVVSHVHELRGNLRPVNPLRAGKRPDRYIAVSEQVRAILIGDYAVDAGEVIVCKPFVPVDGIEVSGKTGRVDWRDFGLPEGVRVVGAVGTLWPTKGSDLFVQMGERVLRAVDSDVDDVHFVWIGGPASQVPAVRRLVDEAGLSQRVHVLGEFKRPFGLMAGIDVFVLPSREDAFPLVALEAGVLERSVVAFDCGAGVREVLGDGRGVLAPPADVASLADEVVALLGDVDRRQAIGANLAGYVREQHDIAVRAPAILGVVESMLRGTERRRWT